MYYYLLLFLSLTSCISAEKSDFSYTKYPTGIEFSVNGLKKRVTFFNENIVRVTVAKEDCNFNDSSLIVIAQPNSVRFEIKNNNLFQLVSEKLVLEIDKTSGKVTFANSQGDILLSEHGSIAPLIQDTIIESYNQFKIKQAFQLTAKEGIYGLGQYQTGYMNYRNKDVLMVQSNVDAVVPFLLSTNNYGILWDNYSHTKFHDGNDGTWFESKVADQIDYYFVLGNSMDDAIAKYRQLTGVAPMFPKKMYGFWQSKERYSSFTELSEVVDKYRENHIPLDNIVQDWKYWGNDFKQWNSMYFKPDSFPESAKNIAHLHDKNVSLMVSIWPQMGTETGLYKELDSIGGLLSPLTWTGGKVYDAYNPDARKIYWDYVKDGLIRKGVDALWMDGTEPEFGGTDSQQKFLKGSAKIAGTKAGPFSKYLNVYSLETTSGIYNNHRNYTNNKRVFILTRSSFAGQQRNASATWSGDVHASYDILKTQISAGLNFSMAGIPYWTHDIGGFYPTTPEGLNSNGIESPAYRELYTRWFQFGVFTPIFRSHGTGTPRETWQFKERDPIVYNSLVKFTELRYKLIEYIYSGAWQVTNNNYSMMRGLMMDFPKDKMTYSIGDQFMFGQSIMVKPVCKNMYYEPEDANVKIIQTENLRALNGEKGLSAIYFKGSNFEEKALERIDKNINFNWAGGAMPEGVPKSNFSIRWEGTLVPSESGTYKLAPFYDDGIRLWIDGEKVLDKEWAHLPEYNLTELELLKGKAYAIKLEYYQKAEGSQIKLGWICPSDKNPQQSTVNSKIVDVYLPDHVGWYDFWTNEFLEGNQIIQKESPIDILPLYIKAGSIIPLVPVQQYIGEKNDEPMEIRIYPGADAEFIYYEDEGDNYNYEKGLYNTILFKWNEKDQRLSIGESTGKFEGYNKNKTFDVAVLRDGKFISKRIKYNGDVLQIKM